jgi:hypothetical protein
MSLSDQDIRDACILGAKVIMSSEPKIIKRLFRSDFLKIKSWWQLACQKGIYRFDWINSRYDTDMESFWAFDKFLLRADIERRVTP